MPGRMMKKRTAEKENNNLITADNNNIADCFAFARSGLSAGSRFRRGPEAVKTRFIYCFSIAVIKRTLNE